MNTRFAHPYVLNVMADDRPGIIAAISGAIALRQGNIDACSQTVVAGYFTQILVLSFPQPVTPEDLAAAVRQAAPPGGPLQVSVRPYQVLPAPAAGPTGDPFVITAFGRDKPGIIHRFSAYLAGKDINVVDLYWDCAGAEFVLTAQVAIPPGEEIALLQADLAEMGRADGFEVRLQHENIFIATNQLRLPVARSGPAAAPLWPNPKSEIRNPKQ